MYTSSICRGEKRKRGKERERERGGGGGGGGGRAIRYKDGKAKSQATSLTGASYQTTLCMCACMSFDLRSAAVNHSRQPILWDPKQQKSFFLNLAVAVKKYTVIVFNGDDSPAVPFKTERGGEKKT